VTTSEPPGDEPSLPPGTAAWWQQRHEQEARRRPRNDGLTIDRITSAALGIMDVEGLDALTMRRLAACLDSAAASLYRHVATREELLVLVMDRVLGEISTPPSFDDWREGAAWMARDFHRVLARHPDTVHLLTTDRLLGPNAMRGREVSLRGLMDAGFPPDQAIGAYAMIVACVLGYTLLARYIDSPGETGDAARQVRYRSVDEEEFPTVRETAGVMPDGGEDMMFETGLATLIAGIDVRYGPVGKPPPEGLGDGP
jgi:AcrR family transcriptional regulator